MGSVASQLAAEWLSPEDHNRQHSQQAHANGEKSYDYGLFDLHMQKLHSARDVKGCELVICIPKGLQLGKIPSLFWDSFPFKVSSKWRYLQSYSLMCPSANRLLPRPVPLFPMLQDQRPEEDQPNQGHDRPSVVMEYQGGRVAHVVPQEHYDEYPYHVDQEHAPNPGKNNG